MPLIKKTVLRPSSLTSSSRYLYPCFPSLPSLDVFINIGNAYGDEGKGKAMEYLVCQAGRECLPVQKGEKAQKAVLTIRFNGGPNAGHTIYSRADNPNLFISEKLKSLKGQETLRSNEIIKFATHQVPSGVLFGVPSLIGKACVVDLAKLEREIITIAEQLGQTYEDIAALITLSKEAHLILPEHIERDQKSNAVGTTGCGIGPAYADKALRIGARVSELFTDSAKIQALKHFVTGDSSVVGVRVRSIKKMVMPTSGVVVMEGAQGFYLDPNEGEYPFVTSSDCTLAAACTYGFPLSSLHPVCCSKAYTTYVGARVMEKNFSPDHRHSDGELLRLLGHEYGVTTGRRRQCIPINLDEELYALKINQCKTWILSKSDILEEYQVALNELQQYLDQGTEIQSPILKKFVLEVNDLPLFRQIISNGAFVLLHQATVKKFSSWPEMKDYIIRSTYGLSQLEEILWWDCPDSEITIEEH